MKFFVITNPLIFHFFFLQAQLRPVSPIAMVAETHLMLSVFRNILWPLLEKPIDFNNLLITASNSD